MKALSLNIFTKKVLERTHKATAILSDSADLSNNKVGPKDKNRAKYLLIADAIRDAIKQGQLKPSEPLPSARKLAEQLNVNRHTIMAALAELVAQGWVVAKERSGYRVVDVLPIQSSRLPNSISRAKSAEEANNTHNEKLFLWSFRREVSLPCQPKKKASEYLYNFSGGYPDIRCFPFDEFKRCFNQFCQCPKKSSLSYGDSAGEKELLEQISTYLRRVRAITDKELLICNGSQEGLYMVAQLLLQRGDKVAVEQLGYPPAWAAFENSGAELVAIKQDDKGLVPEHLAEQLALGDINVIYLTPLH